MINDLYAMAQALKAKGLLQSATHKDIREPANQPGIYIEVNEFRQSKSIEFLSKNDFRKLWTHSKGNHNSFPVIRIHKPLIKHNLSLDFDDTWRKIKNSEYKKELLLKLDYKSYNPESKDIIIAMWSKEKLLPSIEGREELKALSELIGRFPNNQEHQQQFNIQLLDLIKNQLAFFEEINLDMIKDILIGNYDKKKKKFSSNTLVAFDVYDSQNFKYKVRDAKLRDILISALNEQDSAMATSQVGDICQLTGICQAIENDKFPNPKLPSLGNTYLYSNNKDIPCLTRYGMQSLQAFRIGKEIIGEMNDAIVFLTQPGKQNKTWVQLPGNKAKGQGNKKKTEPNLLIAYVEDVPEMENDLAKMLGDAPDFEKQEIEFESLTEQVCSSLKKETEINPDAKIKVIVMASVDSGKNQIIASETFEVDTLISGVNKWKEASHNYPNIKYHIKVDKEERIIEPYCPYPGQIQNFFNRYWRAIRESGRTDLKSEVISGISMKEIFDVFIPRSDDKEDCKKMLTKLCNHIQSLVINIGHFYNRNEIYRINKNALYFNCLGVSLISILLYKLKYYKEDYMRSTPFNIGRLMKLTDVLHREYCLNIRKGDIPPQLLGNSIMPTAVEFPVRALNLLQERIRIYKAWAETDKDAKLAKWAINKMGEVALEISNREITESFNDVEQAQVLLGYLAKIENE